MSAAAGSDAYQLKRKPSPTELEAAGGLEGDFIGCIAIQGPLEAPEKVWP